MNTIHTPELAELAAVLWPIASKAVVKDAYWISTPDGEYVSDNGNEWCRECGTSKLLSLRSEDPEQQDEYILDGGWVSEHDGPIHCSQCGVRLKSNMLTTGCSWEIDHFAEHPPRPGSPDDTYAVHEILEALEYASADHSDLVAAALELGRSTAAAMPQVESA